MSRVAGGVGFVHLRVHSAYSLLEGALPLKTLAYLAAGDRQPALAMNDTGNLFGALEFSEKMVETGIQPIVGCQVAVDFADASEAGRPGTLPQKHLSDIVLLAATEEGYWNLVRLVSRSYTETDGVTRAHISLDWLTGATEGLICLTGGPGGPVDRCIASGQQEIAAERLDRQNRRA